MKRIRSVAFVGRGVSETKSKIIGVEFNEMKNGCVHLVPGKHRKDIWKTIGCPIRFLSSIVR